MKLLAFTLLAGLLLAASRTNAQTPRFEPGEKYNVDLFTGPVLGAGRIVGMAGAHVALANGIDGAPYNPAGYAERYEKEIDWFAWDVTGALNLSAVFRRNDFDNNGKVTSGTASTIQLAFGLRFQFSYFGYGATWQGRRYELRDNAGRTFQVTLQTVRGGVGYSFLNGGLVAGFAVSTYLLDIGDADGDRAATFRGFGGEFGVLIRPANKRYRVGFVARTPVRVSPREDTLFRGGTASDGQAPLTLPAEVRVPWELSAGVAYQFGERRANTPWRNTRRLRRDFTEQIANGTYAHPDTWGERAYQALPSHPGKALDTAMAIYRESQRRFRRHQPRRYVLLAADVIVSGKTDRGHGLEAFLSQTPERSGERVSYGARVGVESEIWPDRMKVRAGSYVEPARFRGSTYRPHGTMGFDVRLFDIWRWSVRGTGTVDLAPRYFNWGIAFGLWW
ncbi:MAG: hypothetical protein ABW252_11630 [Polyangiales bacterium]